MPRSIIAVLLSLILICAGVSYGKTARRASKRPTASASKSRVVKSASSKKKKKSGSRAATSKKPAAGTRAGRTSRAKQTLARRSTQQAPTPERYTEIQQALADKGYYTGPVSGAWGADSVAALKQFQRDQNLADSGKLNSVSIIALGLGPKRNLSARSTTETRPTDDHRRTEGSERP